MEWDPALTEKFLFDPFEKTPEQTKLAAHYFLLVASVTESKLIGRAENSRALLVHLHRFFGERALNKPRSKVLLVVMVETDRDIKSKEEAIETLREQLVI